MEPRKIARHHARSAQLLASHRHRPHPAARAEVTSVDRRHATENMLVVKVVDVREAVPAVQRTESTKAVISTTESDHAEAPAVSAPPGMVIIARPDREPAKAAPTTVAEAKAKTAAPAIERYIRRRPERTVEPTTVNRPRPPGPRTAVIHPPAVVVRRPSPRLVSHPGPAVIGS